ncbi:hypothetical protein ZWY2020_006039 [Hordeum vulgare]|nr:hypothetical protein ZWY2020_006039 [Hordeum vulgare]
MAAMPSQKRLREVSSEQAAELEDDVVHAEKHDYTKVLNEVEAHGKEPLYVVCTSNPEVADEMIKKMRMKLGGMFDRIIGVDVEYTREDEPNQRAAVLQLCLEEMVLVFHITATTKIGSIPLYPDSFFVDLMDTYGFASSKKEGDLVKAKRPRVDCDEVDADTRAIADHDIKDEVVVKFDNLFFVNALHGKNFKQGATSNNYAVMMATKVVELKPCEPDWFGLTKTQIIRPATSSDSV